MSYVLIPGVGLVELRSTAQLVPGAVVGITGLAQIDVGLVASGLTFYSPSLSVDDVTIDLGAWTSGLTFYTQAIRYWQPIYLGSWSTGMVIYGIDFPGLTVSTVRLVKVSLDTVELGTVDLTNINY